MAAGSNYSNEDRHMLDEMVDQLRIERWEIQDPQAERERAAARVAPRPEPFGDPGIGPGV